MAPNTEDTRPPHLSQDEFAALLTAQLKDAVRFALTTILEAAVTALVGAWPYERSAARTDQRNGYYARDLATTVGRIEDLAVPRPRSGYQTQRFARYARRRPEVDTAIADMFVKGVSTRAVGAVLENLTGAAPAASSVARVFHTLASEYQAWKSRPLGERYAYLFAAGTYFTVIYEGAGGKMPILVVRGIQPSGAREVRGFAVGDRENQRAWEGVFEDLKRRGLKEGGLFITDGHQALLNALAAKFPAVARQRCIKHKLENVLAYLPKKHRDVVGAALKAIFYQESREEAAQLALAWREKYRREYPSAVECRWRDLDACLSCYSFPPEHGKSDPHDERYRAADRGGEETLSQNERGLPQ